VIFHIVSRAEWNEAGRRGEYATASLRAEGFIHCSSLAQIVGTANRFFRGQRGLVLLCIDETRLSTPLRYEPPADGGVETGALFPHLYGPLDPDAVTRAVDFPCEPDGSFRLPDTLRDPRSA
jgi:uncharacterized protein (DUF952 family)